MVQMIVEGLGVQLRVSSVSLSRGKAISDSAAKGSHLVCSTMVEKQVCLNPFADESFSRYTGLHV